MLEVLDRRYRHSMEIHEKRAHEETVARRESELANSWNRKRRTPFQVYLDKRFDLWLGRKDVRGARAPGGR